MHNPYYRHSKGFNDEQAKIFEQRYKTLVVHVILMFVTLMLFKCPIHAYMHGALLLK